MNISSTFFVYHQGETKTAKSWRHPLTKPPARSPMTLVKQQAASDEGELLSCFRAFFYEDVCDEKLLFKKIVPVCSLSDGNKDDKCIFIVSLLYINFTSKKK